MWTCDCCRNKTITDEEVVTLERIKREKEIKVGLQATKRKYKKIDNALLANGTAAEKTVSPNQLKVGTACYVHLSVAVFPP